MTMRSFLHGLGLALMMSRLVARSEVIPGLLNQEVSYVQADRSKAVDNPAAASELQMPTSRPRSYLLSSL
ncbi:hypothetical protein KY285_011802 [Solanum tuberosum]|nr:hypothetical protein KY289_012249 [Solanum tuberosum]KAH0711086.1 hypothetical protein KY284_012513 [Solanum tuberosum]KAH0736095.1 hypothetical protein KY285_011802 [Solanum tuberosum]